MSPISVAHYLNPKQMPPISFFATNIVDEDNLESILYDWLALNILQTHLRHIYALCRRKRPAWVENTCQ